MLLALAEDVGSAELTHVEAVLDRGDVDQLARPAQLVDRDLRDADEAELALVAELADDAELLLDRDAGIDPVQLPEVDRVEPQAPQAVLAVGAQLLRAAIGMPAAAEPALGRDHQPRGVGMQRVGDQILRAAVRPRRVDQVDPEPHRLAQDLASGAGNLRPPDARQPHGAEAEPVDVQRATDREGAGHLERRGRDSNPRYRGYRYNGFRDRPIQPLSHPSESGLEG